MKFSSKLFCRISACLLTNRRLQKNVVKIFVIDKMKVIQLENRNAYLKSNIHEEMRGRFSRQADLNRCTIIMKINLKISDTLTHQH